MFQYTLIVKLDFRIAVIGARTGQAVFPTYRGNLPDNRKITFPFCDHGNSREIRRKPPFLRGRSCLRAEILPRIPVKFPF
jgi:hypothetical protein